MRENLVRYYSRRRRNRGNESDDDNNDDNDNNADDNAPAQIVGVNIGKNKITSEGKDAVKDYVTLIRNLGPYSDYMVINVSSPNTPGLRDMQRGHIVRELLKECLKERDRLGPRRYGNGGGGGEGGEVDGAAPPHRPPLLVKISPDLTPTETKELIDACIDLKIDGIVVSNTSSSRSSTLISKDRSRPGGISGRPVRDISTRLVHKVYAQTQGRIPIVGVGGVGSGRDAYDKMRAGASLIQVYTMMIYEGQGLVGKIREELEGILMEEGIDRVEDVVGLDHADIYRRRRALASH